MSDPYLGEIRMMGFNYAPEGWSQCNGTLIAISQYTALYSLIGSQFGGDDRTNFALPDLRGRVPIHPDPDDIIRQGYAGGMEAVPLMHDNLPSHKHTLYATQESGDQTDPEKRLLANYPGGDAFGSPTNSNVTAMADGSVATTGSGQAHSNMQPYLVVNFCIAMEGIYPSRP
ncbi:MAG: phage tail protein [Magnetococcales bacterium]|nr:phage tail protein [Magnetococcales bacterium]